MSKPLKIQFESQLDFQLDAINAIVDIFKGQDKCTSNFTVFSPDYINKQGAMSLNDMGYANKLLVDRQLLLENVQRIQLRNGLKPSTENELDEKNYGFSIDMETGTGKTYVYLRTIMEMYKKYGFTKFVIVVPSISIKEGVKKSLEITETHFKEHYDNLDFGYFVYDSSNLNNVREFAVTDKLQIMLINIQAFAKDIDNPDSKTGRILLEYNDKLGHKPINLIRNTNPIIIVDEPQSTMSTALQKKSVRNLNPLAVLRYSATHKEKINLMYKLDAVDAYNRQLVKEIEVGSVKTENQATDGAYIKLVSVSNKKGITAKLELDVRKRGGKVERTNKDVKKNDDLLQITGLQQYNGFWVNEINTAKDNAYIAFSNDTYLKLEQQMGGVDEMLIKRTQIRKTIEEHLDKELILNPKGIKVLSLFFIDAVKYYKVYDEEGNVSNGIYAKMFEEEYAKASKSPKYHTLFKEIKDIKEEANNVHNGYFSIDKVAKASNKKEKFEVYKDTSGSTKADEDTYHLIMQAKEKLLSFDTKLRFIFSHSALKEGWDNPNVFQICTLKDAGGSEIRRRQEIGRGLRIAVNQDGQRVRGFDVNRLTVMASESYEEFVENLQKEIEQDTGIVFGLVKDHSFNNVVVTMHGSEPEFLGQEKSTEIYTHLTSMGYINSKGKVQDKLREDLKLGKVELGQEFEEHVARQIIETLKQTAGKLEIKKQDDKKTIKVKEQVLDNEEFKALWEKIKYKTTYQVNFDSEKLIKACINSINERLVVSGGKIVYSKAKIEITKGGVEVADVDNNFATITEPVSVLPDIIGYLQNETQLTRKSIVSILKGCNNIGLFKVNPQKYIEGCIEIINEQKRLHIVDGIVYKKIGDHEYYSQELFKNEILTGYLEKNLLESKKSPYEYVVFDSIVESALAKEFESNSNVKVYAKLPAWFTIPTPLGSYNPDWAVLFENDGQQQLFFVVESKGAMGYEYLRPAEKGKIDCGKAHFKALAKDNRGSIKLILASNHDDFVNAALVGQEK